MDKTPVKPKKQLSDILVVTKSGHLIQTPKGIRKKILKIAAIHAIIFTLLYFTTVYFMRSHYDRKKEIIIAFFCFVAITSCSLHLRLNKILK